MIFVFWRRPAASKTTYILKISAMLKIGELMPLSNATPMVSVVTSAVCELGMPPVSKNRSNRSLRVRYNAMTTFMRVPCAIPAALFAAADKGTIAKYSVTAGAAGDQETVAEIVFGRETR